METFKFLWDLLSKHGVIERYKDDALYTWNRYPIEVQREIYRNILTKLRAGKFVNYHPVKAIIDNIPLREFMEPKILSPEQQHLNMKAGIKMAVVRYKGHFPTVTADEAKRFNLEVLRYI
jgi:hypothetical protein